VQAGFEEQGRDVSGVQGHAEAQSGPTGVHDLSGDREINGGDQVLADAVLVDTLAQRQALAALGDHREHRPGHA
jgi:hypothetical protein